MNLRRGFKSECERIALDTRTEIGLTSSCRLDPEALAEHLAIPVLSLGAFRDSCEAAVRQLMVGDPSSFSAATIFCGYRRLIIFNPVHAAGRHANSIAHELAHVLLEHEPGAVRESGGGRRWRPMDEAEADWLAATLLVPRDGALEVMCELGAVDATADHFGVSRQLMNWRLNQTGVALQLRRRADKRSAVGRST